MSCHLPQPIAPGRNGFPHNHSFFAPPATAKVPAEPRDLNSCRRRSAGAGCAVSDAYFAGAGVCEPWFCVLPLPLPLSLPFVEVFPQPVFVVSQFVAIRRHLLPLGLRSGTVLLVLLPVLLELLHVLL